MVVAEVLTGIALVKQATDFIKSNINTAKDIGDIAGQIDDLLRGESQTQKARAKKSKFGIGDQFGVQSVAQEIIDSKLAQEKIQEISTLVNLRFGPQTWSNILAERKKRIDEHKKMLAEQEKERRQQQKELRETLQMAGAIFGGVFIIFALIVGIIVYLSKPAY